jgi:hypothetical protein
MKKRGSPGEEATSLIAPPTPLWQYACGLEYVSQSRVERRGTMDLPSLCATLHTSVVCVRVAVVGEVSCALRCQAGIQSTTQAMVSQTSTGTYVQRDGELPGMISISTTVHQTRILTPVPRQVSSPFGPLIGIGPNH